MSDFLFACNAVLPIVLTVFVGYVMKLVGLFPQDTAKVVNKMVFKVFLPVMLFLNIYEMEELSSEHFLLIGYGAVLTLLVFFIAIPLSRFVTKENSKRSVLVQASFRSNYALIGMPLADALFKSEGVIAAAMLSLVIIPLYNVLVVSEFSFFSAKKEGSAIKKTLIGIMKNPIILGIAAGFLALGIRALLVNVGAELRLSNVVPVYGALEFIGSVATPMALLSLGARFEFSAAPGLRRELMFACLARCFIVPLVGLAVAYFLGCFSGAQFAALIAMLATPVAVSSVPMAQESGADSDLAGQIVVWTTVLSAVTVFASTYFMKLLGAI